MIYDIARRSSQTELDGVEIVKHLAIGVVDGTVTFIDNNKVKKMRGKCAGFVANNVEHCRIRGDVDAAICGDGLFTEIGPTRFVRNMLLECVESLSTQCNAVHEKQYPLHTSCAHKSVNQGNTSTGFASAGRHDQKKQTAIPFDTLHDRSNSLELEITSRDCRVDQLIRERFLMLPYEEKALQVLPCGETMDLLRWGLAEIPKEDCVTIRVKAEGQLPAVIRLDVLALLFRLFASEFCTLRRLLGFDYGQWLPVFSEENVIAKLSGAGLV
jgi:hypothetical protein